MENNNQNQGFKENFLSTLGTGMGLFVGMGIGVITLEKIPEWFRSAENGVKKIYNSCKGKKIKIVSENNETENKENEA